MKLTESQKVATAKTVRRIAELTAKHATGQRQKDAQEHLAKLDRERIVDMQLEQTDAGEGL